MQQKSGRDDGIAHILTEIIGEKQPIQPISHHSSIIAISKVKNESLAKILASYGTKIPMPRNILGKSANQGKPEIKPKTGFQQIEDFVSKIQDVHLDAILPMVTIHTVDTDIAKTLTARTARTLNLILDEIPKIKIEFTELDLSNEELDNLVNQGIVSIYKNWAITVTEKNVAACIRHAIALRINNLNSIRSEKYISLDDSLLERGIKKSSSAEEQFFGNFNIRQAIVTGLASCSDVDRLIVEYRLNNYSFFDIVELLNKDAGENIYHYEQVKKRYYRSIQQIKKHPAVKAMFFEA
jgi:hypothetical protein